MPHIPHRLFHVNFSKFNKSLIMGLVYLLLVGSCLTLATAPSVNAATNWTITTTVNGHSSASGATATVTGTETIHLTESNGQLSGTGQFDFTITTSASGVGTSTVYATGTMPLRHSVYDGTAHLRLPNNYSGTELCGQTVTVPVSSEDLPWMHLTMLSYWDVFLRARPCPILVCYLTVRSSAAGR
jgi:hypothetical protein